MFSFCISLLLQPAIDIFHGGLFQIDIEMYTIKFTSTITRSVIICWLVFMSAGLFQEVMEKSFFNV